MNMGEVREKITLVNLKDTFRLNDGLIDTQQVRQMTVEALVDTGAMRLVMGEELCKHLGLGIVQESMATLAGGTRQACKLTEPVIIRWKDRFSSLSAVVLPGKEEILLGVLPLEDMDVRVNPVDARLEGVHGDEWVHYIR
jgi:clan AA aspartic protease